MPSTGRPMRMIVLLIATFFLICIGAPIIWAVTQPTLSSVSEFEPATVDSEVLHGHVRELCTTLQPRDHTSPEGMGRAADWIAKRLKETGARVEDQPFDDHLFRNVIAHYGPAAGPRIIVGAHYDTAGALPGADDNASGVAGLIELGRLLGTAKLSTPIELVAYALEEPPFFRTEMMGSAVHAASLKKAQTPVRAMIALEMLGYFTDKPHSQRFPVGALGLLYPTTGNFIALVGRTGEGALVRTIKRAMLSVQSAEHPVAVESINAPTWLPGIDFSDHQSYWNHGFKAVMVTDTSFYRNPHYHEASDLPETLDYHRMATVVRQVFAAVLALQ